MSPLPHRHLLRAAAAACAVSGMVVPFAPIVLLVVWASGAKAD